MKSFYSMIIFILFLSFLTSVEGKEPAKVSPTKVVYVLKEVDYAYWAPSYVVILKDGSAWKTLSTDTEVPPVGDVIKSSDGSHFVSTKGENRYALTNIGTIIYTPLKIQKVLTSSPMVPEKDFDEEFLLVTDESTASETTKLFMLSNQLIYEDGAFVDEDFGGWDTAESLRLIRPDETLEQEYLVYLERKEIRKVNSLVYNTTKLLYVNVDDQSLILDCQNRPWKTLPSFAELMTTWNPSHKICVHQLMELNQAREEEGCDVVDTQEELHLPAMLLRQQHGIALNKEILDTWNLRIGLAMNLNTQEAVFIWDWIPPETQD